MDDAIQPSHPLWSPSPPALNFPNSGSLPKSRLFTSGGQSTGAWASASVFPMNTQSWCPLELTGLISLLSRGLSRVFPTPQFKSINPLALNFLYCSTFKSIHDYWKDHSFDYMDLCCKVISMVFNVLLMSVISFFFKEQDSFNFMVTVTAHSDLEHKKIRYATISLPPPPQSISHEVMGPDAMILVFECWVLSQFFHSPLSPSSRGLLAPLHFLPLGDVICISEVIDISPGHLVSRLSFIWSGISHDALWHFPWCTLQILN